jgi:uncharacterized protein with PQ loop repeat
MAERRLPTVIESLRRGLENGKLMYAQWRGEAATEPPRIFQTRDSMEVIGWIGTTLVIIAYYPQIRHLWVEKCAWGISVWTWVIWLIASILLLIYCVIRGEVLLSIVQMSNMASIVITIVLVRRSNTVCAYHLSDTAKRTKT